MPLEPTIKEGLEAIAAGKVVDPKLLGKQAIYMALALNYETHKMAERQLELMEKMEAHMAALVEATYIDSLDNTRRIRQGYSSYSSVRTPLKEIPPSIKKTA